MDNSISLRMDVVPFSAVVSKKDYIRHGLSGIHKALHKTDVQVAYILVEDDEDIELIHYFNSKGALDQCLNYGIECYGDESNTSFGYGVYAWRPEIRRIQGYIGVVFNTLGMKHYTCIDYVDGNGPIGEVFIKENVPKENIISHMFNESTSNYLITKEPFNTYLNNKPVSLGKILFVLGIVQKDMSIDELIPFINSPDLFGDLIKLREAFFLNKNR